MSPPQVPAAHEKQDGVLLLAPRGPEPPEQRWVSRGREGLALSSLGPRGRRMSCLSIGYGTESVLAFLEVRSFSLLLSGWSWNPRLSAARTLGWVGTVGTRAGPPQPCLTLAQPCELLGFYSHRV